MIGTALRDRTSRQMSRPLGPGIMMSRISRSNGMPSPSFSDASSPSATGVTSKPSWASAYPTESRTDGSSSAMRIRPLLISGHRRRRGLGDRQADPEVAALSLDRGGADLAPHHVDHAAGDRQPESESLVLARLRAPVEALEYALDLGCGYSGSGVDHF